MLPFVLNGLNGFSERAIGLNRQYTQAPAAIVAHNGPFSGFINGDMTGTGTAGRLGIEQGQCAGLFVK